MKIIFIRKLIFIKKLVNIFLPICSGLYNIYIFKYRVTKIRFFQECELRKVLFQA